MPCILAVVSGCHLWYTPVPAARAIGSESTTIAGDSVSVYRESRFEIYGPDGSAVFDAYHELNRAYRAFAKHVGAPTRLVVVLSARSSRIDSMAAYVLARDAGGLLRFARPRVPVLDGRTWPLENASRWPIGPAAARLLLAALPVDSLALPSRVDTASLTRFPAWYRAAVMSLAGDPAAFEIDVEYARERRKALKPLSEFLTATRPPASDSLLDPQRRENVEDAERRFAVQSSAFARFLIELESGDALTRLGRAYAAGRPFETVSQGFRGLPVKREELEERWQSWLATRPN